MACSSGWLFAAGELQLCTSLPSLTHSIVLTSPAQEIASLHEQLRALEAAHAAVEQQAAQQAQQLEQQTALATADSQAQQEWLGAVKQVGRWLGGWAYLLGELNQSSSRPPPWQHGLAGSRLCCCPASIAAAGQELVTVQ